MQNVYNFIVKELGLKKDEAVVVAVSGGPDSMALLHIMSKIKDDLNIKVICAHVNHNVRIESEDEKIFVENFCKQNGIIFEYMKIMNYGDDNFHNEARTKRYDYFYSILKKYNSKYLMTAHHGDDLMETILMRIVRGSTLKGYGGFSKIVKLDDYTIIRPLIEVTKKDILEYNEKNNIAFVLDKSNEKDVYTRNRFRKYILPVLKKEDINVHKKFYKFSKTLIEYNNYIEKQVASKINDIYINNELDIRKFMLEEHVIGMKIIYYILEHIYQDDLMLITDNHAEMIYNMILNKKPNVNIYLPNNIVAKKTYNKVSFVDNNNDDLAYEIEINEYVSLPNGKNIKVIDNTLENSNNICRLNSNEVTLPLHVRSRAYGDKMILKGMNKHKKINDIFIDEKISIEKRNTWPIVIDSKGEIIWLPGLKKSKYDLTNSDNCDIILKYY